jgi:hypothetical protein
MSSRTAGGPGIVSLLFLLYWLESIDQGVKEATEGVNPAEKPDLKGADGTYGDGDETLGGVLEVEGPAVDSRSIAGSDIVKKISKPKPKVENFREKRGKNALFQKFEENAGEAC